MSVRYYRVLGKRIEIGLLFVFIVQYICILHIIVFTYIDIKLGIDFIVI